jgi:acyl-coenzyme A thioesterase PaaI-like protein
MEGYVLKAGKRLAFTGFDVRRAKDNTLIAQARHTKAFTA